MAAELISDAHFPNGHLKGIFAYLPPFVVKEVNGPFLLQFKYGERDAIPPRRTCVNNIQIGTSCRDYLSPSLFSFEQGKPFGVPMP